MRNAPFACPTVRLLPALVALLALLTLAARPSAAQQLLAALESPTPTNIGAFGSSVAGVADVDGDSRGDLIVGAFNEDLQRGQVHLFSGATGQVIYTLAAPPEAVGFGRAVAAVPDVDDDSFPEIFAGAYYKAFLFSGADGQLLHAFETPTQSFQGVSYGSALGSVPDVDGDGRADLLVGANRDETNGRAYLYSSATGALLHTFLPPIDAEGWFGFAVAGLEDVDGDGRGEVLISAAAQGDGEVYLFNGATADLLQTFSTGTPGWMGRFGWDVATVPDTDGDGKVDVLIGAPFEDTAAPNEDDGRAYLFSSATGALLHTLSAPVFMQVGMFGRAVAGLGDLDGDGRGDLLIGGPGEGTPGETDRSGQAHVYSGSTGAWLHTLESPHPEDGGDFGLTLDRVPDADGDGHDDLLVGADYEDSGGLNTGRAYLFSTAASVTDIARDPALPARITHAAPYPNPFVTQTTLGFELPHAAPVRLAVYDVLGRRRVVLLDGPHPPGWHEVVLSGQTLPAGLYLYRLEAAGQTFTGPLLRMR